MKKALLSLLKIFLSTIAIMGLGRVVFLLFHLSQSSQIPLGESLLTLWNGLSLDLSVAGYVLALPLLALLIGVVVGVKIEDRRWQRILYIYLLLIALINALVTTVDATLYGYWGYRIDATLLPYLATPKEAAASVALGDIISSVVIFSIMISGSLWLYHRSVRGFSLERLSAKERVFATPIVLLLMGVAFLSIRGGVSASVANVSKVYFSSYPYANHAAINPLFSLLSSIQRVESYDKIYPFFEEEELLARFTDLQSNGVDGESLPILGTKRPNVAILICEGYTRSIMEMKVGGKEVMPNLRRIAEEGLLFDQAYASGSRTDRGVTSVLSGFPSQPLISIMKLPAKSRHLPSLALSLGAEGYSSNFYYGGDLNFMDMLSYLYNTGWVNLKYNRDIESESEPRQWGYSDGVMMDLFADELIRLNSLAEPFLASLLTLSSHEPFDVPEQLGFEEPIINSFAYSDQELGKMVDRLRQSEAWEDLLLIIVADHTIAYPWGITYNSPKRHHIPLILSGGALQQRGIEREVISQGDIPATLLAQMGIDHSSFIFSRDHFDKGAAPHTAYYTFSHGFGVVDESGTTIYDITGERVASGEGVEVSFLEDQKKILEDHQRRLNIGKVTLQRCYLEIDRLGR